MTAVSGPEHGSRTCYQKGCTHESCARANADYKAGRQAALKARTQAATEARRMAGFQDGIPSLQHGIPSTYYWQGCRCQECRTAVRLQQRQYRRIRNVLRLAATL